MPPCPGSILPLSLTPICLLNIDSTKSPNVPIMQIIAPKIIQSKNSNGEFVSLYNIMEAICTAITPPKKPSQLYFGDILSKSLLLPNLTPTK